MSGGGAPAARLVDVSFTYPSSRVAALSRVSLEIGERDFVGVVGPNGGGKTTLLCLLLGLLEPDRGEVEVLGRPPAEARRRNVRGLGHILRLLPERPGDWGTKLIGS